MSLYKGVVVVKKPGQQIPVDFVELCLGEHTSCIGIAIALKSKEGKPILNLTRLPRDKVPDSMKAVADVQKKFEGQKVVFYFGEHPTGASADDIQPHPLLFNEVQGGKPVLAAFMVGAFEAGTDTDGKSAQFVEANEYLTPKLVDIWEDTGYDINKLDEKLRKPLFRKEIEDHFPTGSITMISANDSVMTFAKASPGHGFEWGWASDSLGYGSTVSTVVEPVADPDDPLGDLLNQPDAAPAKPPIEAKRPVADTKPISQQKPTAEVVPLKTAPVGEKVATIMLSPPMDMSNGKKKDWYNKYYGTFPMNFKASPAVPVKVDKLKNIKLEDLSQESANAVKEYLGLGTAGSPAASAKSPVPSVAPAKPAVTAQQVPSKPVQPAGQPQPEERREEKLPIVPPEAKKKFLDEFMKGRTIALIDRNKEEILGFDLAAFSAEVPLYHEIAGYANWTSALMDLKSEADIDKLYAHPAMCKRFMVECVRTQIHDWRTDYKTNAKQGTLPVTQQTQPKKTATAGFKR